MVDIRLTCRHLGIKEDVRAYATKKLEHILKHFDGVHSAELILAEEGQGTKVEVILGTVRGQQLVAAADAAEPTAAVDLVMDKMDRQIKKAKEKLREAR